MTQPHTNTISKLQQAVADITRNIEANPQSQQAYFDLGLVMMQLHQHQAALECFQQAIRIDPVFAMAYNSSGNAHMALKQFAQALQCFNQALSINPGLAPIHYNKGNVLSELGHNDQALLCYQQAVDLAPLDPEAHYNLGNCLLSNGAHEQALVHFDRCIQLNPQHAKAWTNRGVAYKELLLVDASIASCDQAIAIAPNDADAHWNKALSLLVSGNFAQGWQQHEWRWQLDNFTSPARPFDAPLWLGQFNLHGKTILLHSEQGLGDTLQFVRYVGLVSEMGAQVLVEADASLIPLLQTMAAKAVWLVKGNDLPLFDCHCPLMSLPLAFQTELHSIPFAQGYLKADPSKRLHWREKLGLSETCRVGLVWSGNITHKNDHRRSMALSELLAAIPPNVSCVSLQKTLRETDQQVVDSAANLRHFGDSLIDFADTAALSSLMDVVISVDTSVAHLCGALGIPTWLLLPHSPDWRWLLHRPDSPWYASMRLYRQDKQRSWTSVLASIGTDLPLLTTYRHI